ETSKISPLDSTNCNLYQEEILLFGFRYISVSRLQL
ncbi:hypothetical protein CCACVL1_31064, partial [Corchorus capsularis]